MSHRFVRSHTRRKIFLDQVSAGNSLSFSAEAAGGTTSNFKAWLRTDPDFQADYDEAIEAGTDFIEDVAVQRALTKSDPLMLAILKARRPDKYDRGSKLELSGGISVEGSKSKLLNKIARLQADGNIPSGRSESLAQEVALEEAEAQKLLPPPNPNDAPVRGRKRRAALEGSRRAEAS